MHAKAAWGKIGALQIKRISSLGSDPKTRHFEICIHGNVDVICDWFECQFEFERTGRGRDGDFGAVHDSTLAGVAEVR